MHDGDIQQRRATGVPARLSGARRVRGRTAPRRRSAGGIGALLAASLMMIVVAAPPAHAQPPQGPTDIGPGIALGVNEQGDVVGITPKNPDPVVSGVVDPTQAQWPASDGWLWRDGQRTHLDTLGGPSVVPRAVNGEGQVVGSSETADGLQRAFLWDGGHMTDLGTLGGAQSAAYAVNDSGEVVGWSENPDGHRRAFHWRDGLMTDLGTLGGTSSAAYGINGSGEIVGVARTSGEATAAALWSPDHEVSDLSGRVVDGSDSPHPLTVRAHALNDSTQIVGNYFPLELGNAQAYRLDGVGDPNTVLFQPFEFWPVPAAINNAGLAVGCDSGEFMLCQAVAWDDDGNAIELPGLPEESYGYSGATDVNDRGAVVGWAYRSVDPVDLRAVVWHLPVALDPDPDTDPDPGPDPDPEPAPAPGRACAQDLVPLSGFTDTAGNTHRSNIDCVVWYGLARGRTATSYDPATAVRRDQMASFVARLIEQAHGPLPDPTDQGFADIGGNGHADAINQLAAIGVLQGTTPAAYGPRQVVRRDQMASFLVAAFEYIDDGRTLPAGSARFPDTAGNVHAPNIDKIAEAGFAAGRGDGTYGPRALVRRDQMATFLANVLQRLVEDGRLERPGAQ